MGQKEGGGYKIVPLKGTLQEYLWYKNPVWAVISLKGS